jgi:hypothetical protein
MVVTISGIDFETIRQYVTPEHLGIKLELSKFILPLKRC